MIIEQHENPTPAPDPAEKHSRAAKQVAIRLNAELLARLDREAEKLAKEQKGLSISRSDVIRVLILEALTKRDEGK